MIEALLGGLAGVLLLASLAARQRSWPRAAAAARAGAALAVAAALIAGVYRSGGWWAHDLWLLGLGLALAALLVDAGLARTCGANCASPLLETLSALLLWVLIYGWPVGQRPLLCASGWIFHYVRWFFYLVGAASLFAAASAVAGGWVRKWRPDRGQGLSEPTTDACCGYVRGATLLALFTLGAGLVVGAWWFGQAQGQLTGNDARETWIAIAWLIAAMGGLSWELAPRARRWASGLPLLAGLVAVVSLLAAL